MAFQYHEFGHLVRTAPEQAHARLAALFQSHAFNMGVVAKELGTSTVQLLRWIKRLEAAGHTDPRGAVRAKGGRPVGPGIRKSRPRAKRLAR